MPSPFGSGGVSGRVGLWVVAFGVFVAADDLMVVSTMLRPMIDDVGLTLPDDLDATAWIVNVYLIAYITAIPLAAKLCDVFGRRSVFIAGLLLFMAGSVLVPATDSFGVLLTGRAVSALGGGALVPVAMAVASDRYVGRERSRALGFLAAIETLGWVWGPLYGALLVRLLTWQWQFYLNLPLAAIGIVAAWRVLDPTPHAGRRIDWTGAFLLTVGLIALNVALLGQARVQSVTGLEELTGADSTPFAGPWLYGVAAVAFVAFVVVERRRSQGGADPIVPIHFATEARPAGALVVNALLGSGLVIALVNVPLFVNIVQSRQGAGIGTAALAAGWLLTALTTSMAVASYAGGILSARYGDAAPTVGGLGVATLGFALMGWTWTAATAPVTMAGQLALVGLGLGLALAPTSAVVVSAGRADDRGVASGLVIMFRLMGFSIGLAALTAWGLRRFDQLRAQVVLPPLGEEGFGTALADATVEVGTRALAETFLGAAIAVGMAVVIAAVTASGPRPGRRATDREPRSSPPATRTGAR